jgi:hypothetical protein
MTTPLTDLQAAIQRASDDLADVLAAGDDTAGARAALDAARTALQAHQKAQQAAEREHQAAEAAKVDEAAAAAVEQAQEAVITVVERIELPDGVEAPALDADPEVAAAAVAFARVRHELERGLPDRQRLQTKIEDLRGRAAAKRSAAEAIKARRLRGVERAGDAAELHTLSQDADGLDGLLADVQQKLAAMKPDPAALQRAAEAEARLARVQNDAVLRGLVARQRAIEEALVAGARKIRETAFGFGQRNLGSIYVASQGVRDVSTGKWV